MKYFNNVSTLEELRRQYKELLEHITLITLKAVQKQHRKSMLNMIDCLRYWKISMKTSQIRRQTVQHTRNQAIMLTCTTGRMIGHCVRYYRRSLTLMGLRLLYAVNGFGFQVTHTATRRNWKRLVLSGQAKRKCGFGMVKISRKRIARLWAWKRFKAITAVQRYMQIQGCCWKHNRYNSDQIVLWKHKQWV